MGINARELANIEQLAWCINEARQIKFKTPRAEIVSAQFTQANEDLQAMYLLADANLGRPATNSGYYAKLHAVFALFEEFGLKCKNHTCTIALFEYLFENLMSPEDIDDFAMSKEVREETQYNFAEIKENIEDAKRRASQFVTKLENLVDDFRTGKQDTANIKQKISALKSW